MNSRVAIASGASALSIFVLAASARAQTPPPDWYPPPYLAHVSIHAAPSAELSVRPANGSAPVAHCIEYCDFWTLPGRYTLYSVDHSTGERKDLSLRIKQSSRFEFEPGDDSARNAGLALGIGGSAAIVTGFILILPAALSSMCEGDCSTAGEREAAGIGVGFLLAGAIATPIGWTMFVHNRPRLKLVEASALTPDDTSQVRVGVVSLGAGGLGFGASGKF